MNTEQDDDQTYALVGGLVGNPWAIVDGISGAFGSISETADQDTSNVRVYCDFDPMVSATNPNARWQLVADRDGDDPPNSQRTAGVDQEFFDQFNFMRRSVKTLGCQTDSPEKPTMEVFNDAIQDLTGFPDPAGLAEVRSVISMCEDVFDRTKFPLVAWSAVRRDTRLDRVPSGLASIFFKWPLAASTAHEARHIAPFKLVDVDSPNSYGWTNVVNMAPALKALNNADNHAYLDILSELESRQYRLQDAGAAAKAGLLTYDASLS